jgi:N-acylneuraminate cytidylyltransferase
MIDNHNIVCIIPARGKSKRLPGKNILNFLGKPLIAHSIITAKQSKYIDSVYVTTDDDDIAKVSKQFGAIVIKRPDELSGDNAPTITAVKHALLSPQVANLKAFAVILLQPTSPLRPDNLVDNMIEAFMSSQHEIDSLITVSENRHKIGSIEGGIFKPLTYAPGQRSQDMAPYYYENGLVYITKTNVIIEQDDIFGKKIKTFIVSSPFADIDIDTREDFDWAEFVGKKYLNNYE